MPLAPHGHPPRVGMSACPARPRRPGNPLVPRYRGCATFRHKPGGRTLLPRKACLRRAAKTRQHALRGRAKPPCPEAPAPKGAAVLLGQGLLPRGLWSIFAPACTAHPGNPNFRQNCEPTRDKSLKIDNQKAFVLQGWKSQSTSTDESKINPIIQRLAGDRNLPKTWCEWKRKRANSQALCHICWGQFFAA